MELVRVEDRSAVPIYSMISAVASVQAHRWQRFGLKGMSILLCMQSNWYQNWISRPSNSVNKGLHRWEKFLTLQHIA